MSVYGQSARGSWRRQARKALAVVVPVLATVAGTFTWLGGVSSGPAAPHHVSQARSVAATSRMVSVGGANVSAIAVGGVNVPAIAIDPTTNEIWAAVTTQGAVDRIDEISGATSALIRKIAVPGGVDTVAVDTRTHVVWAGSGSNVVTEINESNGSTHKVNLSSVGADMGIAGITVDAKTGKAFALTADGYLVAIIERTRAWQIIATISSAASLTFDPATSKIWVAQSTQPASILGFNELGTETAANGPVGTAPFGIAVDPITKSVWVAAQLDNTVVKVNEITNSVSTPTKVGHAPIAVSVNSATNAVWVANFGSGTMSKLDGRTGRVVSTLKTQPVTNPFCVAVDPGNGRVYVGGYATSANGATFTGLISILNGT